MEIIFKCKTPLDNSYLWGILFYVFISDSSFKVKLLVLFIVLLIIFGIWGFIFLWRWKNNICISKIDLEKDSIEISTGGIRELKLHLEKKISDFLKIQIRKTKGSDYRVCLVGNCPHPETQELNEFFVDLNEYSEFKDSRALALEVKEYTKLPFDAELIPFEYWQLKEDLTPSNRKSD